MGLPGLSGPKVCLAALTSPWMYHACLLRQGQPGVPHLCSTVDHSPWANTERDSSGLEFRPDTHPMAWPRTQALLCLGVKGYLSPFLPSPCVQTGSAKEAYRAAGSMDPFNNIN